MTAITRDQRAKAWNVQFFADTDPIAGVYQHDNFLSIGDVARDLDLCLVFQLPTHGVNWRHVLLPRNESSGTRATPRPPPIVLDKADTGPFPGPEQGTAQYTYMFHCESLCANTNTSRLHADDGPCYHRAQVPERRYDPRYLAIGKQLSEGGKCITAPLRKARSRKRARGSSTSFSHSQSRDSSTSSTTSELENTESAEIPYGIVTTETARPIVNKFRPNVLSGTNGCAISGMGKSWLDGVPGTGIEATHIVPQAHWAVYPLGTEGVARVDNHRQLEMAWRRTWASSNGLPLLSHIHRCFDARLISIHPQSKRVRAFVAYDILTERHGKDAILPPDLDLKALQHHYDMCCIENLVAPWIPTAVNIVDRVNLGRSNVSPVPSGTGGQGAAAFPEQSITHGALPPPFSQVSDHTKNPPSGHRTLPPSPPCSNTGRKRIWKCGAEVIKDSREAEDLARQGWVVEEANEEEDYASYRERDRTERVGKWLCGTELVVDPCEAEDVSQQGRLLHEVDGNEDARGRPSERKRCTTTSKLAKKHRVE